MFEIETKNNDRTDNAQHRVLNTTNSQNTCPR